MVRDKKAVDGLLPRRPARGHDRRLLRRPDPVRDRRPGPAPGRDRPADHLERPLLLAHGNNTDFARGVTTTTPGVSKLDWPVLFFGVGVANTIIGGSPSRSEPPRHLPELRRPRVPGLVTSATTGYPDPTTIDLLRHASVATYMNGIRIPTLLAQGQHDTLFNLQEATATYHALLARKTPVKMLWRSAGHSGGGVAARATRPSPRPPTRAGWRSSGSTSTCAASATRRSSTSRSSATGPPTRATPRRPSARRRRIPRARIGPCTCPGTPRWSTAPRPRRRAAWTSPPSRARRPASAPGTFGAFTSAPLAEDTDVVGIPELTVKLDAPVHAGAQSAGPASMLVLFAKLYDVDPASGDAVAAGRPRLGRPHPGRHQAGEDPAAGHLPPVRQGPPAAADALDRGRGLPQLNVAGPVSVTVDPAAPSTLQVPILGPQRGPTGSGPGGTRRSARRRTRPSRRSRAPAPSRRRPRAQRRCRRRSDACRGASSASTCAGRRAGRVRSVRVTVNGKRVKVRRGKRLTRPGRTCAGCRAGRCAWP